MDDFLAARLQMTVSLGFHIIFACIGIAMPWLMVLSEWKWLRTKNEVYLDLARAWSKGLAIFFAVGAVSGTLLSFELGLLWPTFMEHAGPIFGMPFSWEGAAFFLEAIFLGLYLYGWKRLAPKTHLVVGVLVGISGILSGVFVMAANAWMNAPAGFDWVDGQAINIDPVAAMFNQAWFGMTHHMTIAAFGATCFAVAGVHAILLLKNPHRDIHRKALYMALSIGVFAAILQPLSGDLLAKDVAQRQPAKLAAMESLFRTTTAAPLVIGGWPDTVNEKVDYAIELPGFLSFLAHGDFNAEVIGLEEFPREEWPNVLLVHLSFQIMVALGMFMILIGVSFLLFRWKWPHLLKKKWWLILVVLGTPMGFLAVEVGWVVTELGRQPWIIYGVLKTVDTLTPMPGIQYPFYFITLIYLFFSFLVIWLLSRQVKLLHQKY
ncbi:MAG: cytochrome ubiquinol oxidase subunit I [Bacteroidales bacterium]